MSIFGWSYPPGCSGTPFDEEYPCAVCGGWDINPSQAKPHTPACICPECPECSSVGDPKCYKPLAEGGHGLVLSEAQKKQAAEVLEYQRQVDEAMAKQYDPEQDRKNEEALQAYLDEAEAEAKKRSS